MPASCYDLDTRGSCGSWSGVTGSVGREGALTAGTEQNYILMVRVTPELHFILMFHSKINLNKAGTSLNIKFSWNSNIKTSLWPQGGAVVLWLWAQYLNKCGNSQEIRGVRRKPAGGDTHHTPDLGTVWDKREEDSGLQLRANSPQVKKQELIWFMDG